MTQSTNSQHTGKHLMQPLDALTFPLSGSSLIEASAGTGKTYTIVNLYLRLLLGRGCSPLGVEQILVVTFTNAATAELKERIRLRLRQAYLDFFASIDSDNHCQDPFIQTLIEQSKDITQDCQRLALASKQMDEAAVFTIHGFCQKALTEHAFESGALYDQSFILDESEWIQIAVEDYWRKYLVPLPAHVLQLLLKTWDKPLSLLKSIGTFIHKDAVIHKTLSVDECIQEISHYQQLVVDVKAWWLKNDVSEQLGKANLNGRAKLSKYAFLQKMQAFCVGDLLQLDFDKSDWTDFSPEKITKAAKKGSADLSHLDFARFEVLADALLKCKNAIKVSFSQQAIHVVKANLQTQKQRLQMLSPDDLLLGLQGALHVEAGEATSALANALRQTYPAALIDEFQDTDPVQFEVFKSIYSTANVSEQAVAQVDQSQSCWIMIGDPKQAIYGFRGADIFTYIEAKNRVDKQRHFTLATNWRSAPKLVTAINHLFENSEKGFLFEESIPFYPVSAGRTFEGLQIKEQAIPSLHFDHYCHDNAPVMSANDAQPFLAKSVANQICEWLTLSKTNQALLNGKPVTAGDCCILVRTRLEAGIIKKALSAVNVDSVFLSRASVFDTQIAQDLFRLLKAISQPSEEKLLKTALMSELFSFTAIQLDDLFNDELAWQNILEQRFIWHQTWSGKAQGQGQGLMRALNLAFSFFDVEQVLVSQYTDGLRRITDLHHLVELLQQQSLQLVGEAQLIHWFESCLLDPDPNNESQQMRLENDSNLVQIVTLHASKGLEFPLVFIPFGPSFKSSKNAIYHNEQEQLEVDFLNADNNVQQAEYERLAEDIRLFYVAVTRAVYYCSIGVWNIGLAKSKKLSGFTQSALGCLLLSEQEPSDAEVNGSISNLHISQSIQALADCSDVSYHSFNQVESLDSYVNEDSRADISLQCLHLEEKVQRTWRLTSYSAISRQQVHLDMPAPGQDEGHDVNLEVDVAFDQPLDQVPLQTAELELIKSPFTFERGANAGSFLHGVLENIDFQQPQMLPEVIKQQSTWFGIDESWAECIEDWLKDVLQTPFNSQTLTLGQLALCNLSAQQVKVEMEFYMPLHQVQVKDFNLVINQFFPHHARNYQFDTLNGMIKGFIDLMFEFEGKYYVADYKSNHLGNDVESYNQSAMERGMTEHDYHLQAILYTLALHRWLKHRLLDYHYDKHIGGAYYLFIRGMSLDNTRLIEAEPKEQGQGVYYLKPERSLIENLDDLFEGKTLHLAESPTKKQQTEGQLDLW